MNRLRRHRHPDTSRALAWILVASILIAVAVALAVQPAHAHGYEAQVRAGLIKLWPKKYRGEAYQVIRCETGGTFTPHAVSGNGLYYGLFQQGWWQRKTYGFAWTVDAQLRSGLKAFRANGYCWTCNQQWPTCGRGLD